jgi:BolA-like protein 3
MLARTCLRRAAARQLSVSTITAPLRLSASSLRASTPAEPQIPARTLSSLSSISLYNTQHPRPYSTSPTPTPETIVPTSPADTAGAAPPLEKPDYLNEAESTIWDMLAVEFTPAELMVQDISGGCGSMYGIEISSEKFRGANMLKQQRMVNAVLGDLMKSWHGVQLKTRVPEKTF